MDPNRRCSLHADAEPFAKSLGFSVEVEQDFHVVGDEANWHED